WYVFILSFVTLSLYIPYWFYSRTRQLNQIVHDQTTSLFIYVSVAIYLATWLVGFTPLFFPALDPYFGESQPHMLYFPIIDLAANIFILIWAFKFRNRLNETFSGPDFKIGIVMTFFFQNIYLQYKLNELIDKHQNYPSGQVTNKRAESPVQEEG
ncbi:MAG: DUF4234 domain-containing protein, partial [Pseudomonadota bacterium]